MKDENLLFNRGFSKLAHPISRPGQMVVNNHI